MKTKPQENKSVKTLKGQLFGAVAMMLVAAIALGTSTYAWFINNQTVEVETMNLEVSTSTSMLVAIRKTDNSYTGYKSLITNNDITGASGTDTADWADFFTNKLVPASTTDASLITASPAFFATNNHVTNGKLDQFFAVNPGTTADDVGQGPVKALGLKFLASSDVKVYFGQDQLNDIADLVVENTGAGAVGGVNTADQADAIRRALRVAVVAQSDGNTLTSVTSKVFQFDNGTVIPANGNNTMYAGANGAPTNTHNEPDGQYAGIATIGAFNAPATGAAILTDGPLTALVPAHATPAKNANNTLAGVTVTGGSATVTAPTSGTPIELFELKSGKERVVDVYIWLEGTDNDCLNELSGYNFGLKLPFAAVTA